jgi:hypothetical protein
VLGVRAVVRAGLVEAKVDGVEDVVHITRATHAQFGSEDWQLLKTRLEVRARMLKSNGSATLPPLMVFWAAGMARQHHFRPAHAGSSQASNATAAIGRQRQRPALDVNSPPPPFGPPFPRVPLLMPLSLWPCCRCRILCRATAVVPPQHDRHLPPTLSLSLTPVHATSHGHKGEGGRRRPWP